MKSITRLASALALFVVLALPSLASAATSIYSNSNGAFQYSNNNFSIGWGPSGGGGAFACGSNNICQVATTILYLINSVLVPLLFAISFIVFLWGVFKKYIWSSGDESAVEEGHKLMLWGIIGFVVMVSLWGLVNVVTNTFGLAGYAAPPLPTSY